MGWIAAHGGAGATTLTRLLGGIDLGCRWPDAALGEPARVMLVARTNAEGMRAAGRALNALREGRHPAGMRLVGLVLVADAPGRLPLPLARRIRVLRSIARCTGCPGFPAGDWESSPSGCRRNCPAWPMPSVPAVTDPGANSERPRRDPDRTGLATGRAGPQREPMPTIAPLPQYDPLRSGGLEPCSTCSPGPSRPPASPD
ncbi:hypothetical protein NKG94_02740 [Micromonospora sp. M12]